MLCRTTAQASLEVQAVTVAMSASVPFNGNFYSVAATVIPLFFIALLLPSGFLFKYWRQVEARHNERAVGGGGRAAWGNLKRHSLYLLTVIPPMIVVVAGSVAEMCSILALDRRHASFFEHAVVLVYFLLLPAVTAAGVMILVTASSL